MKTQFKNNRIKIVFSLLMVIYSIGIFSQNKTKQSLTILNIDAINMPYTSKQLGNIARLEVEKLDTFEVMDRYDVTYLSAKNSLKIDSCFGKIGLVEVGSVLKSDKMLSGTIEAYAQTISLTLRLIDVKKNVIEKTYVNEFLYLPEEIQTIIRVSINKMFDRPVDDMLFKSITQKSFDNSINTPNIARLNLSGPRMGFAYQTGQDGVILRSTGPEGFSAYPVLFQFGYQFEKQYLNEGNYQALFEFIPMFTLVNDQKISPSLTILNGIRSNLGGWEFACGLTFSINRKISGYYDSNNNWVTERDWEPTDTETRPDFIYRFDNRGRNYLAGGFIMAIGKTFRSGKLNLPVNLYVNPGKDGVRLGVSFGFNGKKDNNNKKK